MNKQGDLHHLIYTRLCGYFFLEPDRFELAGELHVPKIIVAACSNDTKRLQDLIDAGHDLEMRELYTGKTAIMMAAAWGSLECVKKLIDSGADVNNTDAVGVSALDEACFAGDHEVASLLCEAGAQQEITFEVHPQVAALLRETGTEPKVLFAMHTLLKEITVDSADSPATKQFILAMVGLFIIAILFFAAL